MTGAQRVALVVAAAAGLVAGALTDTALAGVGLARVDGLELGVLAAPLLVLALVPRVRHAIAAQRGLALLVCGCAWTLAPLVDQHLTKAVVVDGALPDLLHHLAGWPAAFAGARLVHRPKAAHTR